MKPGDKLAHYELIGPLGKGGMGEVHRARDTRLGRDVAIKILPAAFAGDAERMARFQREAQTLAALQHPNIASIYGIEQAEGVTFLVMELCEGDDLSQLIARGPVPVSEVRDIAGQIARGLEEAHEKGIIHRDLKPDNVKISAEGRVKILDFGLARTLGDETPGTDISGQTLTAAVAVTQPGVVLGTAAYMSPEQARGKAVDKRTDIWSFGVIVHEMLTGRRLFEGETVSDVLASVLRQDLDFDALPADAPPELGWIVRRCLERDKALRLRDIGEARWAVDADASASSLSALRVPAASPADGRRKTRRNWAWPAVAAVAVVTLLVQALSGSGDEKAPDPYAVTGYTPLTMMSTDAHLGAMAPGGLFFVYTARGDSGSDIFLKRGGGLNPINLTADSPARDTQPAVSPDGQRIAFVSYREGKGVFVMGSTGESARLLASGGARPAWSPDGSRVVYSTVDFDVPWSREGFGRLRIVPADGGEPRELDLPMDAVQPDWSPDGRRIAFWSLQDETAQRDLWSVRTDGTGAVKLTDDTHLDWCPKWSPDGRWLYFLSNRSGMNNLWRLPVDPESGSAAGPPEMATLPGPDVRHFNFAQDGSGIIYTAVRQVRNLSRISLDRRRLVAEGPVEPVVAGNFVLHSWGLSPDGASVAFSLSGAKEDLFIAELDGGGLRQLTNDTFRDRGPSWQDGGGRLLFYSDRGDKYEIWSIRPDGGDIRRLTDLEHSVWFPLDVPGAGFVTAYNDEGTWRLDWNDDRTALGAPELLVTDLPPGQRFFGAYWKPDGNLLAGWIADDINALRTRLAIYDRREGTLRELGLEAGRWPQMAWLPDRSTLLIEREDDVIVAVDIDTGAEHVVLPPGAVPTLRGFKIPADGSALILDTDLVESELWLARMGGLGAP